MMQGFTPALSWCKLRRQGVPCQRQADPVGESPLRAIYFESSDLYGESYMKRTKRFSKRPVSTAVALALGASALGVMVPTVAFAAGMPGLGTVTQGKVTASAGTNTGGPTGSAITGLPSGATLTVTGDSVVQWGGRTAAPNTDGVNSPGFNISAGNVLFVTGNTVGKALLNVDASGNPSVIAGKLISTGTKAVKLFIANANGITVSSTGTIAAPYVGLIGADLTVGNVVGVPTAGAGSAQALFAAGNSVPVTFSNGNGNITVQGTIVGGAAGLPPFNPTKGLLIAGSGSVNVDFTNVQVSPLGGGNLGATVLGGVSAGVDNAGNLTFTGTKFGFGSTTSAAPGYVATNVALNNAPAALNYVGAYGNLSFSGISALPSQNTSTTAPAGYDWKGTLSNTGTLFAGNNTVFAVPAIVGGSAASNYRNRWFDTPAGATFRQGDVGSIDNSGLLVASYSGSAAGLTTFSNGFTNSGTINVQVGATNMLAINSNQGDINLGGVVQANATQPAIQSAALTVFKSGNINVSAPLTIGNSSGSNAAAFAATTAKGNVNITSTVTINNTDPTSTGAARYALTGDNITISANQTVTNVNGSNSKQPWATLTLNATSPGNVTIAAGSTLKAGDIAIQPGGVGNPLNVNLVADGNLTATNTGPGEPGFTVAFAARGNGRIYFNGNSISGAGNGMMTARVFDFDVRGNVRKSMSQLTNNYWTNGLVLMPAGANPTLNIYAEGSGRQFINLRVGGDINVNSATPAGAFFTGPTLSGTGNAGDPNPNRLSQMMLMSTGNITIGGGGGTSTIGKAPGPQAGYFYFPGLTYFGTIPSLSNPNAIGSGSITAMGDVNNSVAAPVAGGQGLYFMTNNLTIGGSLFTNMNSYVNYGPMATQYNNVTYAVQPAPNAISNTLNMVPATSISNVYTIPTSF